MYVIDDLDSQILSTLAGRVSAHDAAAQAADTVMRDSFEGGADDEEFLCGDVPDSGYSVAAGGRDRRGSAGADRRRRPDPR